MENQIEFWKDIPEYEGYYQVSSLGRVKSFKNRIDLILKNRIGTNGYFSVCLRKNNKSKYFSVHKLVAMAFLNHTPCGYYLIIDHINSNKTDNRLENLQIVTSRQNASKKNIKTSSSFIGVSFNKRAKKFKAIIYFNKRNLCLGSFDSEIEASQYYQNALKSLKNGTEIIVKRRIKTFK